MKDSTYIGWYLDDVDFFPDFNWKDKFNVFKVLITWQARFESRQRITQLSDYQLTDIGLTRSDLMRESTKPFWKV